MASRKTADVDVEDELNVLLLELICWAILLPLSKTLLSAALERSATALASPNGDRKGTKPDEFFDL